MLEYLATVMEVNTPSLVDCYPAAEDELLPSIFPLET
jgi:hypothetical protein